MRFGIVIDTGAAAVASVDPVDAAQAAEEAGIDLVLLRSDGREPAGGLTTAAFLAPRTSVLRIIAAAPVGGHPLHIAEQAAVVDNALGGRLLLLLTGDGSPDSVLSETAEIVLAASRPCPFAYPGSHWTVPGNVEGNAGERRISVTPKPAQLELPLWLGGDNAAVVAAELGLSYLSGPREDPEYAGEAWAAIEHGLRRAALRLRRPAIRGLRCTRRGDFDAEEVVVRLRYEAELWGLDVALFALPEALDIDARRGAMRRLASFVRPHLQMDRIPDHLQTYWSRELSRRFDRAALPSDSRPL